MDVDMKTPEIFISYAWQGDSKKIAKAEKEKSRFSDYPSPLV